MIETSNHFCSASWKCCFFENVENICRKFWGFIGLCFLFHPSCNSRWNHAQLQWSVKSTGNQKIRSNSVFCVCVFFILIFLFQDLRQAWKCSSLRVTNSRSVRSWFDSMNQSRLAEAPVNPIFILLTQLWSNSLWIIFSLGLKSLHLFTLLRFLVWEKSALRLLGYFSVFS